MKRYLVALAIGGAVFGTVLASAANLGTVTDGTVGSATGVVQTCQTDAIGAEYKVSWDGDENQYEVNQVELTGLDTTCHGKAVRIALVNSAGAKVAETGDEESIVAAANNATQVIDVANGADEATALEVAGIRVTIYGE